MDKLNMFNKNYLNKLLELNLGFVCKQDELFGKILELDCRTAYRLCLITNSYYLVDKYGLRLNGLFRTFNHRNYSLNQGLFLIETKNGKIISNNLPNVLQKTNPLIYSGLKKIIFIEGKDTSGIIKETFEKIAGANKNGSEYILNIVHKDGSNWEHYFEFIASELFIKNGNITDVQLPWSYHGRPDFGIYRHKLVKLLKEVNLIENGALVLELSALKYFNNKSNTEIKLGENYNYQFTLGEVKTKQNKSQIIEYLQTGLCFKAFEFIPNKKNPEEYCGLIHIKDNKIIIEDSPKNPYFIKEISEKDLEWFENYLKIHLLGNFSIEQLKLLFEKKLPAADLTFANLILLVKNLTFEQIVKEIKNGL